MFRNPDPARHPAQAGRGRERRGRRRAGAPALQAARDRFYKGDIARRWRAFSEAATAALFRYEDFAAYTAKVETPVSIDYRGYAGLQEPVGQPGAGRAVRAQHPRGLRPQGTIGLNSADYIHTRAEAVKLAMADREKYLGDMDFVTIPYDGLLVEGVRARAAQADRPRTRPRSSCARGSVQVHDRAAGVAGYPCRVDHRGRRRPRRRHQLHRGRRQGSQHGELRAQPPQRLRHRGRHGGSRDHLQLPRRLLLARRRRGQRARARQAPAQHAAEHAGDEGRPARS